MELWKEKALTILKDSLYPVPTELNELDWKSGLSTKTERLAQHICAMANIQGGGLLVYGVNNDSTLFSISKAEADAIVTKLGNIAKNNLNISIEIEHSIIKYLEHNLLFVHIPEQTEKPAHIRGNDIFNSFTRSAGQTVKMTKKQVQYLISQSRGIPFEELTAIDNLPIENVLELLNYQSFFALTDKEISKNKNTIVEVLKDYQFVKQKNRV